MTDELPAPPGTDATQAEVRRRGWFRANLVALISLLVVVPALVYVVVIVPTESREVDAVTTREVAFGDSVDQGGLRWTLTASKQFPGLGNDSNSVPTGAALVAAIIDIAPIDGETVDEDVQSASCVVTLTTREGGEERLWRELTNEAVYNYRLDSETQSYCSFSTEPAFELEVVFLAPKDVYTDATIDVSLTGGDESIMRFALQPLED